MILLGWSFEQEVIDRLFSHMKARTVGAAVGAAIAGGSVDGLSIV